MKCYKSVVPSGDVLLVQRKNDSLWNMQDEAGNILLPTWYVSIGHLNDGMREVEDTRGYYNFLDESNNFISKIWFYDIYTFWCNGCTYVQFSENGSWFILNKKGKLLIQNGFREIGIFHCGLALVKLQDEKYNYINKDGKFLFNIPLIHGEAFGKDGKALVRFNSGKECWINTNGKECIK